MGIILKLRDEDQIFCCSSTIFAKIYVKMTSSNRSMTPFSKTLFSQKITIDMGISLKDEIKKISVFFLYLQTVCNVTMSSSSRSMMSFSEILFIAIIRKIGMGIVWNMKYLLITNDFLNLKTICDSTMMSLSWLKTSNCDIYIVGLKMSLCDIFIVGLNMSLCDISIVRLKMSLCDISIVAVRTAEADIEQKLK